jgi:flagellar biogenesis protein FliO
MRPPHHARRLACWLTLVCPALLLGQTQYSPNSTAPPPALLTPITIDEPRQFPASTSDHSRPIVPAYPQHAQTVVATPPRRVPQPPVDFRLVTNEERVESSAVPPRRLLPRSEASQKSLARPAAISPGKTLGTVVGSLAIVLGLFVVIAWCAKRTSPQAASLLPKEAVEVLGRAVLATRQQVQLVRVGNKVLLVAVTPTTAQTLTEITAPADVEHLLGLCRRGQSNSASVAFLQTLTQLSEEPAEPGFLGSQRAGSRGAT